MGSKLSMIQTQALVCKNNGFTLLEVLIALAILSVGILGVVKMQISAIDGNAKAIKYTELMIAAQNQIEQLMQMQYTSVADGTISLGHSDDDTIPENYTLTYVVNTVSQYKQITVSVSHSSDPNDHPSATFTFIIAQDV